MSRLQKVLANYTDLDPAPAGGGERRRLTREQRQGLRADLQDIQHRNRWLIWLAAGMLAVLFVASLAVILTHLDDPDVVQWTGGALGISAAGCVRWLLEVWRRKQSTEILLRLALDLEGEALKTVLVVLTTGKVV